MSELVVYTRPGCPFSFKLRQKLRLRRLPFREVDIWQDPAAAEAVRAAAGGSETVPTVHVAGREPGDRVRGRRGRAHTVHRACPARGATL